MSFTSLSIVKKHLLSSDLGELNIENVPATLNGEDEAMLPHQSLTEYSEIVKWDTSVVPLSDGPLVLSDYDKAALSAGHVVVGSVVVTLGDSLSTVYAEEADYKMDYSLGCLHRVEGTRIPNNQPVYVFYNCYSLFDSARDYLMDYVRGTVRRRSGSSIPDRATVLVDYRVTAGSVTDALISQAILEAEDLIVRSLSTDYNTNSTDQGLQTGASLLVLSFITRDLAGEALARGVTSDAAGRAKEWQNLSNLFELRAWQTLRPFLDSYPIHGPERHPNA